MVGDISKKCLDTTETNNYQADIVYPGYVGAVRAGEGRVDLLRWRKPTVSSNLLAAVT